MGYTQRESREQAPETGGCQGKGNEHKESMMTCMEGKATVRPAPLCGDLRNQSTTVWDFFLEPQHTKNIGNHQGALETPDMTDFFFLVGVSVLFFTLLDKAGTL